MKFGMPTLVELNGLASHAELAKELSLEFIEINMSFPEYTPGVFNTEEARAIAERYGVFYTIHADEYLNPFDFNPEVSDCYFSVMRKTIAVAKSIGARVINLHLQKGIYVTLPGRVILLTNVKREEYLSRVAEFINMCEEELRGTDIKVAIENVDSNPFSLSQIEALGMFMKSDVFALTLDVGHECMLDYKDTPIFEKYPEKVLHMHLHDCKDKKPHLELGVGNVDIEGKLALLCGETCLIEVKTVDGLRKSVEYLKKG